MGDQISEMAERAAARCAIFLLLALVCTATGSGLADESVVVLDSSETDARGGRATTTSDLTRAEELSNDAKEAGRVNAEKWLQLTQAKAQVRKSQSELDQCVIDALKARKSAQNSLHGVNMQTEAVDVSTKKLVALQAIPSTSTAETQKNDKDIEELKLLKASSQKAKKKAQLQSSAKATAATAKQSECDRKRELLAAHEKLVKKLQREHAAAKYRKQNMVRKAQSMK